MMTKRKKTPDLLMPASSTWQESSWPLSEVTEQMEWVNDWDALVSVHVEVFFLIHTSLLLSLSNFPLAPDSYCPREDCASSQNIRLRAKYSVHFEFCNGIVTRKFGCLEPSQ